MRALAFFDVDETLLNTKSMFDFLRFQLSESDYAHEIGKLRAMAARGADRGDINRAYYRLFAGASWTDLLARGRLWYAEIRSGRRIGPPFIAAGVATLHNHRAAGHYTALISGSFQPCLQPLAEHLGADIILGTEPEIDSAGRLTGEVYQPVIGPGKRLAAHAAANQHGLALRDCYAYGDHASDLDLLQAVGMPTAIGQDPLLLTHAHAADWPVLSATELVADPETALTAGNTSCTCGCAVAAWSIPTEATTEWTCASR
ncbi:HAD-superfamily subfamily IB hydrolase, TIGR01490 [Actinopolyspora xinjiangensis]|uniref:HAD-superfamily subfamily IB hydrolase, TIGR01490 n=1 Tax=Actinopolyspora xinjiangensis TaxID=405564 RepID=A0A1H0PDI1_9ACTN|nr:HAD-IB family hydrolase [Actinopolyspora xinjiangensis]SDP02709.1 HAD-superfamily subfamily IB hydrolase, TIGR01490 [Actinopolyspora xinjiangensis]